MLFQPSVFLAHVVRGIGVFFPSMPFVGEGACACRRCSSARSVFACRCCPWAFAVFLTRRGHKAGFLVHVVPGLGGFFVYMLHAVVWVFPCGCCPRARAVFP